MPADAYRRYAIYYTVPPGPLARFGAEWLGWDIEAGCTPSARASVPDLPRPIETLTTGPHRYGFHATIKPPFRLAPGASEAALTDALANFCTARPPVPLHDVELACFGRFVALVARGDAARITALASGAVRQLDTFRAAPSEAEIARHLKPALTARQIAHLHRWGYPHVMDCFRWHMTLTAKLPRREAQQTCAALAPVLAPLLPHPLQVDALSLVGEDADGRFHLVHRAALTG
ncbi:phosphonate metabolism protein [Pelagivirga sediminicola]|uniref:Phosphonate metabolism protein n=1 Tax=Pelagivirga sediminicola TaxID=2170575 RepID=A0A2T7G950_9RHOB|nr:DUF1045 domain-containing protein [Pelagivirga sediminicola]PVA10918.1 phosphonate metabolism protein [Pelagivirga sediminicola]